MTSDHFQGKSVVEHLKDARAKGAFALAEIHGAEMPGHLSAGADAAKETAVVFLLLLPAPPSLFIFFTCGWILWKIGRSALLGWARIERLHRVIEEERWEIEHHREQEREELKALYQAKGLTGKLLDETVSVFMADDNRLLRIMLEEEMGLTLEVYEHPLKQSAGAATGVLLASALFALGWTLSPSWGPFLAIGLTVALATYIAAKAEKRRLLEAVIWNLSLVALIGGFVYLLRELL